VDSSPIGSMKRCQSFLQVPEEDAHVRRLRVNVETYAAHWTIATGCERRHAFALYKQAMQELLSYL